MKPADVRVDPLRIPPMFDYEDGRYPSRVVLFPLGLAQTGYALNALLDIHPRLTIFRIVHLVQEDGRRKARGIFKDCGKLTVGRKTTFFR